MPKKNDGNQVQLCVMRRLCHLAPGTDRLQSEWVPRNGAATGAGEVPKFG